MANEIVLVVVDTLYPTWKNGSKIPWYMASEYQGDKKLWAFGNQPEDAVVRLKERIKARINI